MTSEHKKMVYDACIRFLDDWDRQDWMRVHGEWASVEWGEEREAYDEAHEALSDLIAECEGSEDADKVDVEDLQAAVRALAKAADALDGQVFDDESDYIAEGEIDPDGVSEIAKEIRGVSERWEGWDCTEGWDAYRAPVTSAREDVDPYAEGDQLYILWWRNASGQRHDRWLWVHVDAMADVIDCDEAEE